MYCHLIDAAGDFIQQIMNAEVVFAKSCQKGACLDEIQSLENEIAICISEQKEIKRELMIALSENLKKDFVIENLTDQAKNQRFDEYKDKFSSEAIQFIRNIGTTEKEDSTFVLMSMRGLYENNLSTLANKTYTGVSKCEKNALTPTKSAFLKDIYNQRLKYIEEDGFIISATRRKKFAKHVKTAIESINRKCF